MNTSIKAVSINGQKYLASSVTEQGDGKTVLTGAMQFSGNPEKSDFQKYAIAELENTLVTKTFSGNGITREDISFTPEQEIVLQQVVATVDLALSKWENASKANYLRSVFQ